MSNNQQKDQDTEREARVGPDPVEDFIDLLKAHLVPERTATAIARYIASTGSADVFDKPEELAEMLDLYPKELSPVLRKRILTNWFAHRKVPVPQELVTRIGMSREDREKLKEKEEAKKRAAEGAVWTIKEGRLELAKPGEPAITREEAKQALAEMQAEEPIVIYDEATGRHKPNYKSDFVKKNPMVAITTAKEYDRMLAGGEEVDPLDIFIEQTAKVQAFKESLGIALRRDEVDVFGQARAFYKDIAAEMKKGEGLPQWMTDPVSFITTVQQLGPKEPEALKELQQEVNKLRQDLHEAELKRRDEEIANLKSALQSYRQEVDSLKTQLEKNRQETGQTTATLLTKLVDKLPDKGDIKSVAMQIADKLPGPPPRWGRAREGEIGELAEHMESEASLREAEDWIFNL